MIKFMDGSDKNIPSLRYPHKAEVEAAQKLGAIISEDGLLIEANEWWCGVHFQDRFDCYALAPLGSSLNNYRS